VPTSIAVTVTSHITQNGDVITGDTTHVVIVKTDLGYAGNPATQTPEPSSPPSAEPPGQLKGSRPGGTVIS
jgi:hypothetical protein